MRPMLATSGSARPGTGVPTGPEWVHEIKWDGVRLLADVSRGRLRLLTRSGRDVAVGFPELAGLVDVADDMLLDGEAVAMLEGRPTFSGVVDRVHVATPAEAARARAARPATYLVFDLLRLDGLELTGLPWRERRAALEALLPPGPSWQVPPTYADGPGLLAATAEQGLEGIVSKRVDSTYLPGVRSPAWLKFPHREVESYVVGGWRPETGRSRLGALLVGVPAAGQPGRLSFRGRVGSGLAGRAGAELAARLSEVPTAGCPFVDEVPRADSAGARWLRPEVVVDVASLGVTSAGRLRQPSYQGQRPDLDPQEVTGGDR
jgi:bifunctional non-homologous end joining protein LigD